jgi:hypothetical protein
VSNNYTKLPQWAQQEISLLKSNLAYLQGKYDQVVGNVASAVTVVGYTEPDRGLPERSCVRFELPNGYVECQLNADKDAVVVHSNNFLEVLPRASNSLYLKDGAR